MIPGELFQPATASQIRQFACKLDKLAVRYSYPVEEFYELEQQATIKLGEDEVFRASFGYSCEGEFYDEYTIRFLHAMPFTRQTDMMSLARRIRAMKQTANEEIEVEAGENEAEDEVIGYLEQESKLRIFKSEAHVDAKLTAFVNVLDPDFNEADAEIAYVEDGFVEALETVHLYEFPDGKWAAFEGGVEEARLSEPTPADLITAMNGLIRCGFASPRMTAFRGAAAYSSHFWPARIRPSYYEAS